MKIKISLIVCLLVTLLGNMSSCKKENLKNQINEANDTNNTTIVWDVKASMPPYAHILIKSIFIDDFSKIGVVVESQLSIPNEKWYALFEMDNNGKEIRYGFLDEKTDKVLFDYFNVQNNSNGQKSTVAIRRSKRVPYGRTNTYGSLV